MAERTSNRAGSRRTTPQPAPQTARTGTRSPPNRTKRTTRSQSRDLSDLENGNTGSKIWRGAKQATPDGKNGAVGQSDLRNREVKPANPTQNQQDLSMVVEDPNTVYPDLEIADDGAGEDVEQVEAGPQSAQPNHKSPGGLSAFSGTTARISLPAQELTTLSPEDMLDTLPDLSDASEKLLRFVFTTDLYDTSVAGITAQSQNKDARENKKLKRLVDTFERQRKEYGEDSYINVGETVISILGRKAGSIDGETALWRLDALLQKANLAVLVSRILSIAEHDQSDRFLEDLAGAFPQHFVHRFGHVEELTPECSALAQETFQVALEVRTQEAIMLLARQMGKINFDPDTALFQVFYIDPNHLRGWAVSGLRIEDLGREAKDTILRRVEQVRKAFRFNVPTSSEGQSSAVESLRVNFPWTTFAQKITAWARRRLTELENQTTTNGGAQAICQALIDVIHRGRLGQSSAIDGFDENDGSELRLEYDTPTESRATSEQQDTSIRSARAEELNLAQFSADSNKLKIAAAHLKERQNRKLTEATEQVLLPQNRELASNIQVPSSAGPSMRALTPQRNSNEQGVPLLAPTDVLDGQAPSTYHDENWRPGDNEEQKEDADIARNAQASLEYRTQREAESNKENVAEISESQHTKTAKKRSLWDRDPLAERVSPIESQDSYSNDQATEISSDEGFQRQAESSNAAMQRRWRTTTKRPAPEPTRHKRPLSKKVRVQESIDNISDARVAAARDERETELPLSQAYEEYVRVNQSAKEKIAVVTKPPQRRSAWTSAETDMLYYLITEHGTSWKFLKEQDLEQGHVLEARDQVALKDKARNMKMDYLKAGRVLPQNFERIPLSQLQIKRLRDGGVEYDPETGTRVDAEVVD